MLAWEGFWCIGGAGYTLVYTGDKEHSNKDFTKYSSKIYCSSQRKSWSPHSNKDFTKDSSKIYCSSQRKSWFHGEIRISLKILPRYIVPAREKVDSMEKRIFGILQKSSYITLGSLSCHTIVLFRNCVLLPWPARILVYSLANYSCHNNNTIQVLLLFQHYCCKPVAQLHCVPLPWPARILVYSLANYSCHNNNTIQVLLLFQHYCCKPVAQLHSAQKKTMKQPKAGKCHFFRNCSWFAPWPINLVTIILWNSQKQVNVTF